MFLVTSVGKIEKNNGCVATCEQFVGAAVEWNRLLTYL